MLAEDNKAVVRRWIEAYNDRDMQAEADARAPGYLAHVQGAPGSLDSGAWTCFLATFGEAFPDLRLTVEEILSERAVVAARVAFRGTHRRSYRAGNGSRRA